MYSVLGKVTALAGSMIAGGARPAAPADPAASGETEQAPPPEAQSATLVALDAIGRNNQAVRNVCANAVQKVASLATLGADLDVLFGQVNTILRDLECARLELVQRDAVLGILQEAHDELKQTHAGLHGENERHKSELGVLRPESERLIEKVRYQEARIDDLEAQWTELRATLAATETQLESERARSGRLTEETSSLRAEVAKSDALISRLQVDLGDFRYRLSASEESARSLQASLGESQQAAARLAAESDGVKAACEAEQRRVAVLETEAAAKQAEHLRQYGQLQREIEQQRAVAAELHAKYDQLSSLHEVSERTLAETRAGLQAKADELRQEQRRTRDALAANEIVEKKLQAEAARNAEIGVRLAETDKTRTALATQVKSLLKTAQERKAEAETLQQCIDTLNESFEQESRRNTTERERHANAVKELNRRLEDEKARRALAEGALEEDRRAKVKLQLAVSNENPAVTPEARPAASRAEPSALPRERRIALL